MHVVICGPNLNDQRKGTFHVHASGCHDLVKNARREPEYRNGWVVDVNSREDIVRAIYSDHIAEHQAELDWMRNNPDSDDAKRYTKDGHDIPKVADWRHYDDVYLFPCVTLPDESTETDFAAIQRMSMGDGQLLGDESFDIDSLAAAVTELIGEDKAESLSTKEWDDMLIAYLNGMMRGFTKSINSLKADITG
jgi:hypothetical protein